MSLFLPVAPSIVDGKEVSACGSGNEEFYPRGKIDMRTALIFVVTLLMTGCATSNSKARDLWREERFQEAARMASNTSSWDNDACFVEAVMYAERLNQRQRGISLMKYCVSIGSKEAQKWFADNNMPVPERVRETDRSIDVNIRNK